LTVAPGSPNGGQRWLYSWPRRPITDKQCCKHSGRSPILQALTHVAHLLAAQQHALDLASEVVRLQRISYANGGIGILTLLDAQHQHQRARLGYVRAEAQRYQATIRCWS
jgi:hypothetical protein